VKVLSLFDGMGCGRLALERAGVVVDEYYASEVDKYAMAVTQHHYPSVVQLGDVASVRASDLPVIDILIGGSPCQGFSSAGNGLNFNDPRSSLFFEYVRLLRECSPRYFLLENVAMKQEYVDIVSKFVGWQPVKVNSALVCAQNRRRLYWTNLCVKELEDRHIVLRDIIDPLAKRKFVDLSRIHTSRRSRNYLQYDISGKGHMSQDQRAFYLHGKHGTLQSSGPMTKVLFNDGRIGLLTAIECERLQTVPDDYTFIEGDNNKVISDAQRKRMLGNGWTVDVIAHIFNGLRQQ